MKHLSSFNTFSVDLSEAALAISPVGLRGKSFVVKINGHEYGYGEKEGGLDLKTVADKFGKILKYSAGRALTWLKKNTDLISGSKKNESLDIESLGFFLNESGEFEFKSKGILEAEEKEQPKEEKKKETKKKEEKEIEDEVEETEMTPSEALDYIESYIDENRSKMDKKDKNKFSELVELLKVFIKERRDMGRKY